MATRKDIRIAVSGIYDYALEELPSLRLPMPGQGAPDWVEEKRIYKVYRPATVLAAACDKFKALPLTHHHPQSIVDGANFRKLALGWTGDSPWVDHLKDSNEVGIRSTCMIYDDEALDAYDRGEKQLSPGYIADFEWKRGTAPDGQEYDIIMKEIKDVNHLALLPAGRGGADAVVLDKAAEICHRGQFDEYKDKISVFTIVRNNLKDGAPKGNDNASKDHVSKEENEANKKRIFGKEFTGVKETDAIKKLIEEKEGFVQNAFERDDIGGIDVVWGEISDPKKLKGYGLKKILAKYPKITPEIIADVIKHGKKTETFNGCNLEFNGYLVGLNNGYKENGKYVTTDNFIVTSFKNKKEEVNDTKASADILTSGASEPENLFLDEIIIHTDRKSKSIFELARGSVFDRVKRL